MKIYCVRHGHAESMPNPAGERPLTEHGVQEITRIANHLANCGVHISHVMHSDKERTTQTATILAKSVAENTELESSPLLAPSESVESVLELIEDWHDDTMLVGHMPYISQLVSVLVTGSEAETLVRFTPGTVVCLERYEGKRWIINWMLRPDIVYAV